MFGFGRGPFWGGSYRRRRGMSLFPMGGFGMGMGGFGMGGGGGLLGDLAAGGIGYLMGKQSAQQTPVQQYQQPYPQYQQQPYQAPQTPQYQAPQQQQQPYQAPAGSGENAKLAQLNLLGHLRDSGRLTNDEFEAEKQKILHGY